MTPEPPWERGIDLSATIPERAVLAVSGGADSMAMASLLVTRHPERVAAIATFDHGTGSAAAQAARLVTDWARARGIAVRVGRAPAGLPQREAAWRAARWAFLQTVSDDVGAPVATAHSEDDQAETVFMRLLRGSGVRGLAGLLAPGPILRPVLALSRPTLRAMVVEAGVPFLDDPSNDDLRHLRNRVRLEILPSVARDLPWFREWLLSLGRSAAVWRHDVSDAVDRFWSPALVAPGVIQVPMDRRRLPTAEEAALFWPEVAGRVGVALDWRGTARLASFSTSGESGRRMPLAGGAEVATTRAGWTLRRPDASETGRCLADRRAPSTT